MITIHPLLESIDISKYLDSSIECVIVGGESGSNVRLLDYSWVLDIREQCIAPRRYDYIKFTYNYHIIN